MSPKKRDPYGLAEKGTDRARLREKRDRLGLIRREPLTDHEWEQLKWKYADRVTGVADVDLLADLADMPTGSGTTAPRPAREEAPLPMAAASRVGALSALVALEADERADVKTWRERALPSGPLLFTDEVSGWLRERAGTLTGDIELLDYATPSSEAVERIAVERGGILDDLRILAANLARDYRWTPYLATVFVLTKEMPPVPSIRTTVTSANSAARSCIRLEIDPWTDPKRVAEAYTEVRGEVALVKRFKAPSQRALDVVEWVARFHQGDPTAKALDGWNAWWTKHKRPDWKFDDLSKFQRTYRDTAAKVLDPKIL